MFFGQGRIKRNPDCEVRSEELILLDAIPDSNPAGLMDLSVGSGG